MKHLIRSTVILSSSLTLSACGGGKSQHSPQGTVGGSQPSVPPTHISQPINLPAPDSTVSAQVPVVAIEELVQNTISSQETENTLNMAIEILPIDKYTAAELEDSEIVEVIHAYSDDIVSESVTEPMIALAIEAVSDTSSSQTVITDNQINNVSEVMVEADTNEDTYEDYIFSGECKGRSSVTVVWTNKGKSPKQNSQKVKCKNNKFQTVAKVKSKERGAIEFYLLF